MSVRIVYQIEGQRVYSEAVLDDHLAFKVKNHVEQNLPGVTVWFEEVRAAA